MKKQDKALKYQPGDQSWDPISAQEHKENSLAQICERFLARGLAIVWRWGTDRQAVASTIGRYSAHLAIVAIALIISVVGKLALTQVSFATPPQPSARVAAEPVATPTSPVSVTLALRSAMAMESNRVVYREALPYTDIQERVRLNVITYTVQSGDNIFSIAQDFSLSPYSVAWCNMETLQGAPWLVQPGLTLFIPPVDGTYHPVAQGETLDSIAETYEVDVSALYNQWNELDSGAELYEGMMLFVLNGTGEDVEWEPPPASPSQPGVASASGSWGYCGADAVSGPGANGWFILPTGSYAVSGWYFGDPRNPGHIGLDYQCHLGDPIYAADNGVVVFSGWNGGYGNLVRVNHGNGYETYYAHFNSIAVGCGQSVYQGQIVGYCGTTGYSTGPHLHYEIRFGGVPQNPQFFEP